MRNAVKRVLVLDDHPERRLQCKSLLESVGACVVTRPVASLPVPLEPICAIVLYPNAAVALDLVLRDYPQIPILLGANPFIDPLVLQQHDIGLIRGFSENFSQAQITDLLNDCRQVHRAQQMQGRIANLEKELVGNAASMQDIRASILQLANSDVNVLIRGESGTGKEIIARSIHALSAHGHDPFMAVNCGAIPSELLESELFGHERGAFTGAAIRRLGRFELAKNGTVFLDEIGDMPCAMQVKLLRVLQEKTFERVGGNQCIDFDARLISATHCDLEQAMQNRSFREDLYYRINVYPVYIPALRDRNGDIPLLIDNFIQKNHEKYGVQLAFTPRALQVLMSYPWPGNVRELSNFLERLLVQYPDRTIDLSELPDRYRYTNPPVMPSQASMPMPMGDFDLKAHIADLECHYIRQALDECQGIVARAAQRLGIGRTTLVEKMRKYQIYRADIHDEL